MAAQSGDYTPGSIANLLAKEHKKTKKSSTDNNQLMAFFGSPPQAKGPKKTKKSPGKDLNRDNFEKPTKKRKSLDDQSKQVSHTKLPEQSADRTLIKKGNDGTLKKKRSSADNNMQVESSFGAHSDSFNAPTSEKRKKKHKKRKSVGNNVALDKMISGSPSKKKKKVKAIDKQSKADNTVNNESSSQPMPTSSKDKKKSRKRHKKKLTNALETDSKENTSNVVASDKHKEAKGDQIKKGKKKRKLSEEDGLDNAESAKKPKLQETPTERHEKNLRTVFVGNVPVSYAKNIKKLKKLFKKFGEVDSIRARSAVPEDAKKSKKAAVITGELHPGRHNINAYVVFKDQAGAKKALVLNGTEVEGFHLRVDLAQRDKQFAENKCIFVGNLPFDAKEEDLRKHFEDCGSIDNVRVVRDKTTGLGKGVAYVQFTSTDAVSLALQMKGRQCVGRQLRVERAAHELAQKKTPSKSISSLTTKAKPGITARPRPGLKHSEKKRFSKEVASFQGSKAGIDQKRKDKQDKRKKKLKKWKQKQDKKKVANILTNKGDKPVKKAKRKDLRPTMARNRLAKKIKGQGKSKNKKK